MTHEGVVRAVRLPKRDTLVSVCRACSADGTALRAALKREFKRRGSGKSVRVVKSSCLGICPKRAVAVAVASDAVASEGCGEGCVRYFSVAGDAQPAVVVRALLPQPAY